MIHVRHLVRGQREGRSRLALGTCGNLSRRDSSVNLYIYTHIRNETHWSPQTPTQHWCNCFTREPVQAIYSHKSTRISPHSIFESIFFDNMSCIRSLLPPSSSKALLTPSHPLHDFTPQTVPRADSPVFTSLQPVVGPGPPQEPWCRSKTQQPPRHPSPAVSGTSSTRYSTKRRPPPWR